MFQAAENRYLGSKFSALRNAKRPGENGNGMKRKVHAAEGESFKATEPMRIFFLCWTGKISNIMRKQLFLVQMLNTYRNN